MSLFMKFIVLAALGMALGVAYDVVTATPHDYSTGLDAESAALEFWSYAAGLVIGMALWQLASLHWHELPDQIRKFIMAQMHIYQFVVIAGASLFVLFYV